MKPHFLVVGLVLGLLASCMTYRVESVPGSGVEIKQNRGDVRQTAQTDAAEVTVSAQMPGDLELTVTVKNKGDKVLTIDSDQFRFYAGEGDRWSEAEMISSADYYAREEKRTMTGTALLVFGAILAAADSPPPYYRRTTTTVVGTGPGSSVVIVRSRTYYDEDEALWRAQRNAEAANRFAKNGQDRLQWLKDHLFYKVDLEPKASYEGFVTGVTGRHSHYKLVIPVDGKELSFVFRVVKERSFP